MHDPEFMRHAVRGVDDFETYSMLRVGFD